MPSASQDHASAVRHRDGNRRVVQHGRASTTSSIADALVIKNDELFFLCNPDGGVPIDAGAHGLGLYYHDCRYLNGYELRLGDVAADRLAASAGAGFWATLELTNPDVKMASGNLLEKERIGIRWERTLDANATALLDTLAITNFSVDPVEVPLAIALRSGFESLFDVRGAEPKRRGTMKPPRWDGGALHFEYDGADGVRRTLRVEFDPAPDHTDRPSARFTIPIAPHQIATIHVALTIHESGSDESADRAEAHAPADTQHGARDASNRWIDGAATVRSDDPRLDRVLDRSLRDLHLLRTRLHGRHYFAAGVPWYVALFGRDSIIAAIEAMAFLPDIAEDTARLLASFQGTTIDDWRDEAPGKIPHELRVGEMAHLDEIPQTPYYGSVDATPLFVALLARHARWTGRLDLFRELKPHVDAALEWIDRSIAEGGTGYLTYTTKSSRGLSNQGWKDSGDSIVNRDGSLAEPPIALVEVQGYVYLAKRSVAELYRRTGDENTARRLEADAAALQERFERDFWSDDLGTYALALQKGNRPAAVAASNPGQALWTGIASAAHAARAAARLMDADMFSGWGIRTLSSQERRYNPIGYHDGTVWPHDNAIAVAGFRRYGCLDDIMRTMDGMLHAAAHFDHDRLPEVFAGFDRRDYHAPVHYPVACHPQAWAAGAVPFMVESALGLEPDAFNHRLTIAQPALPASAHTLTIDRLRIGDARARIVFARDESGRLGVRDLSVDGHLDVVVAGEVG